VTDYSWMLQGIVDNVPQARHLVLLSADGIPQGATQGMDERTMRGIAATMAGMQSLSRATGLIVGPQADHEWKQTLIEFDHGLVFVVAAGEGSYLAAAAGPDVDMQAITFSMQQLVTRLGRELTAPPRTNPPPHREGAPGGGRSFWGGGPAMRRLDEIVEAVPRATRAILVRADGLPGGVSSGMEPEIADKFAAAMLGLQGLSKATAPFAGPVAAPQLRQTVVEFSHGWLVSIATGDGGCLAAAAEPSGDIADLAGRMHDLVYAMTRDATAGHEMARHP
jgi:predicted regulator of Ras-like GTPase activity (Roadblock/LC7/MglB family)